MKLRTKLLITVLLIGAISSFNVYKYVKSNINYLAQRYPVKYSDLVEKYSESFGVDETVIYATILCESNFIPDAESPKGAAGLMQITPETFEWLCTKTDENYEELNIYDPETNIKYGTFFLSMLYQEFGDATIVHAAYNAGRGRVREWLKNSEYCKDGKLYFIPYKETRIYVERIKNAIKKYSSILEEEKDERDSI